MKTANLYYFYYLNVIGGTETFLYELSKKYKKYDITVVYEHGDPIQINRLKKFVRCVQYHGQYFECEKAFFNYGTGIISHVQAKDYYLVIHADYKALKQTNPNWKINLHPKLNKFIAVSQNAAKSFTEVTGRKCEVSYNPFTPREPKKVLHLISATRLSKEKGKQRMEKLGAMLDAAGIPYVWTIFTDDTAAIKNPNIIYMKPRLDIINYIADADYLVQLSDNEGYCYSVIEALCAGTPVIVTPCPVFNELNIEDGKNCYKIPFDMKNFNVSKLLNIPKDFNYTPPADSWDSVFVQEPSVWEQEKNTYYKVRALPIYSELRIKDGQLGKIPSIGETWYVNSERKELLTGGNERSRVYVRVIEEVKREDIPKGAKVFD